MTRRARAVRAAVIGSLAALAAAGPGACGRGGGEGGAGGKGPAAVIQNKGSDTMVNLAQAWAEAYKAARPEVDVEVSGGGSGVGIAALTRGAVHIANASRDMKPQEVEAVRLNTGQEPSGFIAGYDALAVIVHRDNPLEEVSLEQLAQVYGEDGRVARWSELGVRLPSGHDGIIRVSRQSSSGTYEFFRERVCRNRDFKLGSLDLNGSKEVVELVANTPGAIGYSGMGYTTPAVKMLRVARAAGAPAVPPSAEAVIAKTYPIARSLHLYTVGPPQGAVGEYIDWILGPRGQQIVQEAGYVPAAGAQAAL